MNSIPIQCTSLFVRKVHDLLDIYFERTECSEFLENKVNKSIWRNTENLVFSKYLYLVRKQKNALYWVPKTAYISSFDIFSFYASFRDPRTCFQKNHPVYTQKKVCFRIYVYIDFLIENDLRNMYILIIDYGPWVRKHSTYMYTVLQQTKQHKTKRKIKLCICLHKLGKVPQLPQLLFPPKRHS